MTESEQVVPQVYISGPMTGLPDLNFPAFEAAQNALLDHGFLPINPARHGSGEEDWTFYLRLALMDVAHAHGVALLPGWQASKGAQLEVFVAHSLGLEVQPLDWWLAQ